jgi:hypothetical protein
VAFRGAPRDSAYQISGGGRNALRSASARNGTEAVPYSRDAGHSVSTARLLTDLRKQHRPFQFGRQPAGDKFG